MPRGDIHNREEKLEWIKNRIKESDQIPEHNKELLLELDKFNLRNREVGLDRRSRDLETWYSLATHIGDDWKLDNPTEERISELIGDIKEGKVTQKDNPSRSQRNEFKKALNKMYHSRQKGDKSLLRHKNSDYDGSKVATFTYDRRKRDIDPATVLQPKDVAKLIEGANRLRDKLYIVLMWSTAARVGEVLGLKWKDINFRKAKGRRVAKIRIKDIDEDDKDEETKTNVRTVPIREGYSYAKRRKQEDPLSNNGEAYVFRPVNSTDPDEQLSHKGGSSIVSRVLKTIKENEDIEGDLARKTNNHNLRHSRATYWASEGMNESQIRALGGWSNNSKVVSDYIHLGKEDVDKAVLNFHDLEIEDDEKEDFNLLPVPCPKCKTLNPFNAEVCQQSGCDKVISMNKQSEEIWIEETSKEVAMEVAQSEGGITKEEIHKTAQELVQNKMES